MVRRRGLTNTRSEPRLRTRKSTSSVSVLTLDSPLSPADISPLKGLKSRKFIRNTELKPWTQKTVGKAKVSKEMTKGFGLFQELYPFRLPPRSKPPSFPNSFLQSTKLTILPKGSFSEVSSPSRDFSINSPQSSPGICLKVPSSSHRKSSPTAPFLHFFSCLGPSPDLPSEAIKTDLFLRSSAFRTLRSARPISIRSGLSWSRKDSRAGNT